MTLREALGGPWASHWLVLVGLIVPTTLLVFLREIVTPYPEWWWPLVSAIAQHLAAALVIAGGMALARHRSTALPIAVTILIWIIAAAARGLVVGAIASAVTGVDPEYASRMGVWVLISMVWLPLLVYAVAQFERRRLILGSLDIAEFDIAREKRRADDRGADVQQQLRTAIAESISPAIHDLQASLDASRDGLDRATVAEVSMRVSQLHDDVTDLAGTAHDVVEHSPAQVATLRRAFDVAPRRPWFTALVVALMTLTVIVPDAWRIFGPLAAIEVVVSAVTAAVVMGAALVVLERVRRRHPVAGTQHHTTVASVLGIALGSYLMLNSGIDPITWHGLLIVPLLAMSLVTSCITSVAAIVLADINNDAAARHAQLLSELAGLREINDEHMERERRRVAHLMHGPVQGRIAACIMALNFHATGSHDDEQSRYLTDSVLDHLRLVSRDFAAITSTVTR